MPAMIARIGKGLPIDRVIGIPNNSRMLTSDALAYFDGSQAELARALGIKPPSVADWGPTVPPLRQIQLERLTGGKLKASPDVFGPAPINGSAKAEAA